jgi:hypothetical protein
MRDIGLSVGADGFRIAPTRRDLLRALAAAVVSSQTVHAVGAAAPVASPSPDRSGSAASLLDWLPALPLGGDNGGEAHYVDLAGQLTALRLTADALVGEEATDLYGAAIEGLALPSFARWWRQIDDWPALFGFAWTQVERAAEYTAPPLTVTVLRGRFDPSAVRAAWTATGYHPITLDGVTAYQIRDDYDMDPRAPDRFLLGTGNDVALLDDGTIVFASTRDALGEAMAAGAGRGSSLVDEVGVADLVRTAPSDLVSVWLVEGARLIATPLPPLGTTGTPGAFDAWATGEATAEAERRRLGPVAAALLGMTAGGPMVVRARPTSGTPIPATPVPEPPGVPAARLVVMLAMVGEQAASAAVPVIEERLETGQVTTIGTKQPRSYSQLFSNWEVRTVAGSPVVLVELTPAWDVSRYILVELLYARRLGFVAWSPT